MKKAIIISHVGGFLAKFELNNVRILQKKGYEVHYASNFNNTVYESDGIDLKELGILMHQVDFERKPFSIRNKRAYNQLKDIMRKEKYDVVHCHTPIGGAIGRMAARACKVEKVIYTAHGFHFYKGASVLTWMMFYPIERLLARWTDILITINQEDYYYASKFHLRNNGKVLQIPGVGVDVERFQKVDKSTEKIRRELNISEDAFVLISVGEINKNKNQQVVIRALNQLNNPNIIYLICGKGDKEREIKELIRSFNLESNVRLLGYQTNVEYFLKAADCFVFPSIGAWNGSYRRHGCRYSNYCF